MVARNGEHWAAYNDDRRDRAPRPLCAEVLSLAGDGGGRAALDVGCGAGVETAAMLDAGWRVCAMDSAPGTRERVLRTAGAGHGGLTVDTTDLGEIDRLPPADLVYAGYSLPYVAPRDFPRVWGLIRASLRPGAWLAVNLFGDRDSWAGTPDETFLDEASVRALFDGLRIVRFGEEDAPGESYGGPKHWHVFDVIARRDPGSGGRAETAG